MLIQKKILNQSQTNVGLTKAYFFMCTQIQAVEVKLLGFVLQNVHLTTKYLLSEKICLLTSLQAEIQGRGGLKGLLPASFVWQKAQPFIG